ncbi:FUSC family protein [Chryseobacterium shandongense]|uniref:FUSC family protein n=1 Tax=Chryseobacterium shandongense TaxID=1493872 RepID=A0ABN5RY89_9FLAO|nr:FUSC family protein [Chryseobacterium shandongense]
MKVKELESFTDTELLAEEKALKSFSIMNAFIIGFLVGIIIISIYFKAYTLVLLIPLFLIYKLVNDPKNKRIKEVERMIKERNLK